MLVPGQVLGPGEQELLPGACRTCGLYKATLRWAVPPVHDSRIDLPDDAPWILVVGVTPSAYDSRNSTHLSDPERGGDFLRDYLNSLEVKWSIVSSILCYPGKSVSPSAAQIRACGSEYLGKYLIDPKYKCIVTLGAGAMKAVLGKSSPRSLTAAGTAPIEQDDLPPVLVGTNPFMQVKWEEGKGGADLSDDYFRLFETAEKVANGKYEVKNVEFETFTNSTKAITFLKSQNAKRCYFDCETNTWSGVKDRETIWHPDAKLLCVCITYVYGEFPNLTYVNIAITGPALTKDVLYYAFVGKECGAHNLIFDVNALYSLLGFDLYDVASVAFCTMVDYFLRDSAVTRIGLKTVAPMLLGVPDWSILTTAAVQQLYAAQDARNKQIKEARKVKKRWDKFLVEFDNKCRLPRLSVYPDKNPDLVSEFAALYEAVGDPGVIGKVNDILNDIPWDEPIGEAQFTLGDISRTLLLEYCSKDTWCTARIGEEKLYISQDLSNMSSPQAHPLAMSFFRDLIWFLAHLERYGLPADKSVLEEMRISYGQKIQDECCKLLEYDIVRDSIRDAEYYKKAKTKRKFSERFSLEEPPADLTQLVNTKSEHFMVGVLRRSFVCLGLGAEQTDYSLSVPYRDNTFFQAMFNLPSHVLQPVGPMQWDFNQQYLNYVVQAADEIYGEDLFPNIPLTDKEKFSFSKDALMPIAKVRSPDRNVYINEDIEGEISRNTQIWRSIFWVNIWRGIISRDIGQYIDYVVGDTLHTNFKPVKTEASPYSAGGGSDASGGGSISRVQSSPNVQNFKTDVEFRNAFHVPKGELFYELDFSTVEPRTLAVVADIPAWKEIFRKGLDIYRVLSAEVDQVPIDFSAPNSVVQAELAEKIPKIRRDLYKQQVLAVMYERGPASFAAVVGITYQEAVEFFETFAEAYPEIEAWKNVIRQKVKTGKAVETLFFRRAIFDYRGDEQRLAAVLRSAINYSIQATGSCDIPIFQLIRVLRMLLETGLIKYVKPVNFVHDAGWFRSTDHVAGDEAIVRSKGIMEDYSELPIPQWDIPLPVAGKLGTSPGNMTSEAFEDRFPQFKI